MSSVSLSNLFILPFCSMCLKIVIEVDVRDVNFLLSVLPFIVSPHSTDGPQLTAGVQPNKCIVNWKHLLHLTSRPTQQHGS